MSQNVLSPFRRTTISSIRANLYLWWFSWLKFLKTWIWYFPRALILAITSYRDPNHVIFGGRIFRRLKDTSIIWPIVNLFIESLIIGLILFIPGRFFLFILFLILLFSPYQCYPLSTFWVNLLSFSKIGIFENHFFGK